MRPTPKEPAKRPGPGADEEAPGGLPLRATGIVLSLWMVGMVFLAFFVVPLIFATCFPTQPPPR